MKKDQKSFLNQLNNDIKWSVSIVKSSLLFISEDLINFKRSPKKWSAAQCLDHVIIVNELYLKKLKSLNISHKHQVNPKENKIHHGWIGKLMLKIVDPQTSHKYPSPRLFKPKKSIFDNGIVQRFIDHENALYETFESFRTTNLNKYKISSPGSKLVRLNLADAFKLIIVHQKRHINQALESLHLAEEYKRKDLEK